MSRVEQQVPRSVSRLTVVGLVIGILLFLWSVTGLFFTGACFKAIMGRSVEGVRRSVEISPWDADAWASLARIDSFLGNYKGAFTAYERVVSLNPLSYQAWVGLLWLSLKNGQDGIDEADLIQIIDTLNPTDFNVHWNLLLYTMSLDKPWAREVALREIRILLPLYPEKGMQFFAMAALLLGSDKALLGFVPEEKTLRRKLLDYLLFKARRPGVALSLWSELEGEGWTDDKLFRGMISGLMGARYQEDAWRLWRKHFKKAYQDNLIFNGSFENNLLNYGFSWRAYRRCKGLKWARVIHYYKTDGDCSFSLAFDGEQNPDVWMPFQYVYLEPGSYVLQAHMASKALTSASGFSLEVSGPGVHVSSPQVKGDTEWTKMELGFHVSQPGIYRVGFHRRSTQKLNRFLGGKVFFDEVTLVRGNGQ